MRRIVWLAATVSWLWLSSAYALGLGEIDVKSHLNQRLVASIPVSSASPDEIDSIAVQLASNEDFARAGIERLDYLSSLKFEIKGDRIEVTSSETAREPFLSFLLEVRWKGGKLLREYTMLLDPPTMAQSAQPAAIPAPKAAKPAMPAPAVPAAQPAPSKQAAAVPAKPTSEFFEPTQEAPKPVQAPAQAKPAAAAPTAPSKPETQPVGEAETYGPVEPKETLWSIAYRLRPDPATITMNQMQVALFKANPEAFEGGKITGLKKGAVLRVPTVAEIKAIDPATAKAQMAAPHKPKPAAKVAKSKPVKPAPATAAPAQAEVPAAPPEEAVQPAPAGAQTQPKTEVPPTAEPQPKPEAAAPVTTPTPQPATAAPDQAPAAGGVPPTAAATAVQTPGGEQPQAKPQAPMYEEEGPTAKAPETTPQPPQAVATTAPPPIRPKPTEEVGPSHLDELREILEPYLIPALAGIVAIGVLLFGGRKLQDWLAQRAYRKAAAKTSRATAPVVTPVQEAGQAPKKTVKQMLDEDVRMADTLVTEAPLATTTAVIQPKPAAAAFEPDFAKTIIQEPKAAKTAAPQKVDFDLTQDFAAETVQINLDAGDPVSEADFHLAYGLYDEAALLLKQAAQKDPARTELRVKLAETYFAAGKAQEFLQTAEGLKGHLSEADWQKLAIMGRQLVPDAALFQGGDTASLATDVDLSFDEPAEPAPAAAPAPKAESNMLDFKLEDFELPQPESPKPAAATAAAAENAIEFDLGEFKFDQPESPPPAATSVSAAVDIELKLEDLDLGQFDLPAAGTPAAAESYAAEGDLKLDLDADISLGGTDITGGDEVSTKLDLARAYLDMGDSDMARGLLNEVLQQGNAQQKDEAQELMQRVPS